MAKKFSFAIYDRKHLKNLLRRAKDISSLLSDTAREGARIGEATGYTYPNGEFAFDKFPAVKQRVDELFKGLHDQLLLTVTEGNREEWMLSAAKNDALVESRYSRAAKKFADRAEAWTEPHLEALEQFNTRKERGMNLSDRVWKLTDQFKGELELALELGLGDGKSAAALSRDVREYLNEPHKLFRRVRNEKGQLRLSKAAAAYHPGQGVYRSSYKNALRLTATENNMAYRTADHERWNDLDFVIGIEIMLSNNHPVEDICDEMCGVYPKTFKFVGWHPFCRCIAVPKLADEDEFIARQQALIDGEELPQGGYVGEVTEMPQCFTDWVQENAERIETAKSQPYFIQDNRAVVNTVLQVVKPSTPTTATPPKRTIEEIAAERHAKRDEEAIQERWNERRMTHFRAEQDRYDLTDTQKQQINAIFDRLKDANFFDPRTEFNPIWEELQKMFEPIREMHNTEITTLADVFKGITSISDSSKLSYRERFTNALDALDKYYGDSYSLWTRVSKIYRSRYTTTLSESAAETLFKDLKKKNWFSNDIIPCLDAMQHVQELRGIATTDIVPMWREEFNSIITRLNGADISKGGFKSIYNDVELAYNILKLSADPQVRAFGLERVSTKMPYNLLSTFQKKIPGYKLGDKIPGKEFWDSLDRFTPLVQIPKKDGAHFSSYYKYVHISLGKADAQRLMESPWYQTNLLHHEFGHAFDDMRGLRTDKRVTELYKKFVQAVARDNAVKIEQQIGLAIADHESLSPYFVEWTKILKENPTMSFSEARKLWTATDEYAKHRAYCEDMKEQIGGLSDCVMGAISGTRWIAPRGHPGSYFENHSLQVAEFIAHMSESYWGGNEWIEKLAPGTYRRMRELYAKILGLSKRP